MEEFRIRAFSRLQVLKQPHFFTNNISICFSDNYYTSKLKYLNRNRFQT